MGLLKESTAVLMNATPASLDLEKVRSYLTDLPGVLGVHYLHAWQVSSASTAFSCHVLVADQPVSRTEKLAENIKHELFHLFDIDHPVLEFETSACGNGTLLCELACTEPAYPGKGTAADKAKRGNQMRDQFLYHTARIILGLIFLFACYDKLLNPRQFAEVVYNYQILPDGLVNVTAILLPWVELVLGLSLIVNVWIPGSAVLGNLLLLAFFSALIFNLARGLDVSCGCFSTAAGEEGADARTVLRDLSFLIVSGYLFYAGFFRTPPGAVQTAYAPPNDNPI